MTTTTAEKRVYLETFGCQMNLADSEVALSRLAEAGYSETSDESEADLIVFNTCSVRDNAEAKIRGRLGNLKRAKRERPSLKVAVMGCMAQRGKEELLKEHSSLDLVVGTDQFVHLPELLKRLDQDGRLAATEFGDFEDVNWHASRREGVNAWVPVMRGCNYNCTYCIVPKTRGKEKSRPMQLIEEEVREAVDQGHVQITLLGQTIDAYGKTLGDGSNLASLLRRLHAIEGLQRLRFITSHPKDMTDELLDTIAELPKVAKHLHVPAQAGSSRVLRLMGRRYTREGYLDLVRRARERMPDIELQTDIIVGFPTETEEDFLETRSLMQEVEFAGAYVFMYSVRPGTGASRLEDDVPKEVKRRRCNDLLALQLDIQEKAYANKVGNKYQILVESVSKSNPDRLTGRTLGNLIVHIPRAEGLIGQLVDVEIETATNLSLIGRPL